MGDDERTSGHATERVLVLGLDPAAIPGYDPEPVQAALRRGGDRFAAHGIPFDYCLVGLDEHAEQAIVTALQGHDYGCVVVGGGIRKPEELLEFFETVVNLVRRHAPRAAIAFNTTPDDSADAALRQLSAG